MAVELVVPVFGLVVALANRLAAVVGSSSPNPE
jgi:hypothetical protein